MSDREEREERQLLSPKDKEKLLSKTMGEIADSYGNDVIFDPKKSIEVLPTGSIGLDLATGIGGWPRGRVVDLYGKESSGKSLLALLTIAEIQKQGGYCVFIDAEHAFYTKWAEKQHVDPSHNLTILQPDNGEQAFNMAEKVIRTGAVDLVVIDSTAALVPMSIVESDMEDKKIADQARLISVGLQKLTPLVSKTKTVLMFIDQVRGQIGGMRMPGMPEIEKPTGGAALNFYSSCRFRVKKKEPIKDGDRVIGNRILVQNKKNKVAPPFKETEFDLYYETGIDHVSEIFENCLNTKTITLEGRSYSYKDTKWIGQDKCRDAIKGDTKLQEELVSELKKFKESLV